MKLNLGNKIDPEKENLLRRIFDENIELLAMMLKLNEVDTLP